MNATPDETGFTNQQLDAIRADAKQVVGAEFPSIAAAAKDAGIAYATFSAFLNGTYNGNNDKIGADVQKWLRARKERVRAVMGRPTAPGFVATPTANKIIPILQYAQMAPDFAVVVGAPGLGKTMTMEHYRAGNPNVWMATMEPSTAKPGLMMREIGRSMGLEMRSLGDASAEIRRRVKGTQGLILIDDGQFLSTAALDQLRVIHDKAQIGVAIIGNEALYANVNGNGRKTELAQLFSRVGMRWNVQKPADGDIAALLAAWGVTAADEVKWLRVIARKPGALRGMTKVLTLASLLAAGAEEPRALRHMQAAWGQLAGADVLPEAA